MIGRTNVRVTEGQVSGESVVTRGSEELRAALRCRELLLHNYANTWEITNSPSYVV